MAKLENLEKLTQKIKIEYPKSQPGSFFDTIRVGVWTASGMIGGCGPMQLTGLRQALFDLSKSKKELEALKNAISGDKMGAPRNEEHVSTYKVKYLIAYMGKPTKKDIEQLESLGFKLLDTYPNWSHAYGAATTPDTQGLFVLSWK